VPAGDGVGVEAGELVGVVVGDGDGVEDGLDVADTADELVGDGVADDVGVGEGVADGVGVGEVPPPPLPAFVVADTIAESGELPALFTATTLY